MRATWWAPVVAASALLLVGAAAPDSGVATWLRLQSERDAAAARIEALEAGNRVLERQVEALRNDPFAVERAIREDLELVRKLCTFSERGTDV